MADNWDPSVSVQAFHLPQSERRWPRHIETVTLTHVPLLCRGAAPAIDLEEHPQHDFTPGTGVVVGALISMSFWATLIGVILLWIA